MMRHVSTGLCFVLVALFAASPASAQFELILRNREILKSQHVEYRESTKRYVLIDRSAGLQAERSARDVVDVRSPRPAAYTQAVKLAAKPATRAQAIPLLEEVVDKYLALRWDVAAGEALAAIYNEKGRHKDAARMCQRIIRAAKPQWVSVGLRKQFLDSLVKDGNYPAAESKVREMLRIKHPPTQALAYLVRGDVLAAQNKLEEAMMNGYLRAIVLYPDVRSVRPEALAKGAKALERLRDPRAATMRQLLLDQYPSSPFARSGGRP